MRKQAKTIETLSNDRVKEYLKRNSVFPKRDYLIFCLSRYAGLRACEIARVEWSMVLDSNGQLDDFLALENRVTKGGYGGGCIPLHSELKTALQDMPKPWQGTIVYNLNNKGKLSAKTIVNMFLKLYKALDLTGCSSHSGRRTFITQISRKMKEASASVKDVMGLSRHKHLSSLQHYIDFDVEAQKKMVSFL